MIWACILSGLAGYFIRATLGVWKEWRAWKDGHTAGREQASCNLAMQFEDLCEVEIARRLDLLRDKREVSGP